MFCFQCRYLFIVLDTHLGSHFMGAIQQKQKLEFYVLEKDLILTH